MNLGSRKERDQDSPLLPETQELLEQLAEGLEDDEPVIHSTRIRSGRTQPLGEDGMRDLIKRLFRRPSIEYQGHDLRRTFCTIVREASGDEFLAMRLARDIIPGVNDRYINARPVHLGESLRKYSPLRLIRQMKSGEKHGGGGGELNSPSRRSCSKYATSLVNFFVSPS